MDLHADFLVIGSGVAALRAAAELSGAGHILILTKAEPDEGNTGYAQGGIAAAIGSDDSPKLHAADTIAAGDGLCDDAAVRALVEEGPGLVRELIGWGAEFDRDAGGEPSLTLEGAHSVRRVLHARDATGREIGRALWTHASALPGVSVYPHAQVVDLIVEEGRCVGACFLDSGGATREARAPAVLLATGGAGQVYRETTNPAVATGDGIAMGYRAGAAVADLEFVQFHPTALKVDGQPRFLLSEALRGEGARLVNAAGESFVARYERAGDLASRDRVARAIVREEARTDAPIFLSLQQLDASYVHARFPLISAACRRAGLDLARDPIPVGPAAHYVMGGVVTDLDGCTTVPGLFAAGEVACTGVHGANRLASNSLLEGLVFGARAARGMKSGVAASARSAPAPPRRSLGEGGVQGAEMLHGAAAAVVQPFRADGLSVTIDEIRDAMWRDVGLFRTGESLRRAVDGLEQAWQISQARINGSTLPTAHYPPLTADDWRTANLLTVARLIARAALRREESRGAHYRDDYPQRDDIHWKKRIAERI